MSDHKNLVAERRADHHLFDSDDGSDCDYCIGFESGVHKAAEAAERNLEAAETALRVYRDALLGNFSRGGECPTCGSKGQHDPICELNEAEAYFAGETT